MVNKAGKKLTVGNITKGMVFKVTDLDEDYLQVGLGLGTLKDSREDSMFGIMMNPQKGDLVRVVKPPYGSGGKRIDWELLEPREEELTGVWESYWSMFKANTEYVTGDIKPTVSKELTTPSADGKFKGFEVSISHFEVEDYMQLSSHPHVELGILLEFKGEFQGSKKLTTKHINQIKVDTGFKEHIIGMIEKTLEDKSEDYEEYYSKVTQQPTKHDYISSSNYEGGRVRLSTVLAGSLEETKNQYRELVEEFIQSKTCRVFI